MSRRRRVALAALVGGLVVLVGCGRHVVVDPDTVASSRDGAWTVQSQPRPVVVIVNDAAAP